MAISDHQAKVNGMDLPISTKQAIEVCKLLKGKSLERSRKILQAVIDMEKPVPFTRHKRNVGHRPGRIAAGRYPQKASREILKLVNSLEANAENKGLNVKELYITTIMPNFASRPMHFGRLRQRKTKRTHIQIIAEEREKQIQPQRKETT